ncbi:DUF6542 domain-containing protein [Streptomyces sp. I05A-00742]|uniref:DUF6542 domain-containing protein n=1 Tax=Streptomyces sp. I05A-00742 TaxID=2732853 RepID=UPI001488A174|nr:DUF6542 domain-containing protein [Streptomyces sp. I05A-00742]
MEQPGARITQHKVRRAAPVPRPAAPVGQGRAAPAGRDRAGRTPPQLLRALRRDQPVRLTGLGSGLLAVLAMLTAGLLVARLAGGSPAAYGVLFVLCCVVCALGVRPAELVAAPVGAPIAFAVGAVPVTAVAGGPGARVMAMVSFLSLQAGWLYGGTLLCALIVLGRRVVLVRRRRLARVQARRRPSRPPRSPRRSPAERARSRR